jgi:hypothetical protein
VTDVAVLIPVLSRPDRVAPLLASLEGTGAGLDEKPLIRPTFLCSPDDEAEIAAVAATGLVPLVVEWEPGQGDYARKINHGATNVAADWFFLGADDLRFHPGWLAACLLVHSQTGACVIGTNDLGNPRVTAGEHATHSLVHADYRECGTLDEPDSYKLLHEGYWHNFVDDEFVGTAKQRGTFAMAADAHVEHLHPNWRKSRDDETYRRGLATFHVDQALHFQRSRRWRGVSRRTGTW